MKLIGQALALALVWPAMTKPASAEALCGVRFSTYAELLAKVKSTARFTPGAGGSQWTTFTSNGGLTVLVVSLPDNAAHPAAACRRVKRSKNGSWTVDTRIACGGPTAACNALPGQFKRLDEAMKKAAGG